jgi:LPS sulfotransferase NodH
MSEIGVVSVEELKINRFLIVSAARTGSTMLRNMLNSHPDICCHGEVFSMPLIRGFVGLRQGEKSPVLHKMQHLRKSDPLGYLREYVFYPGPFKAIGAKILYDDLLAPEWKVVFDAILADRDLRIVHLFRENRLKRFLSHYITRVTNVHVVTDLKDRPPVEPIWVSPKDCVHDIEQVEQLENQFRDFFHEHPVFEITYEQIVGNRKLDELQRFLGLGPATLRTKTVKLNSDKLQDLLKNYGELEQAFRGTKCERYLPNWSGRVAANK